MKQKLREIAAKQLKEMFTVETTKAFQRDMDKALKTMRYGQVVWVLLKYDIRAFEEVKEFLDAYSQMLKSWRKPYEGTEIVGEVKTRGSKCIACVYGKDMTVYEFQYKHTKAREPYNYIVYGYDFGMLYDIRDGILHDLRICNAFLSRTEIEALRK